MDELIIVGITGITGLIVAAIVMVTIIVTVILTIVHAVNDGDFFFVFEIITGIIAITLRVLWHRVVAPENRTNIRFGTRFSGRFDSTKTIPENLVFQLNSHDSRLIESTLYWAQ